MIASSTSDTVNPVSDQCELAGVPCVTSDDPWQAWFFPRKGDPKKGFEWTYHFFWGFDMVGNTFADMWLTLPTNKIVGTMFTNDPDGIARQRQGARTAGAVQVEGLRRPRTWPLSAAVRRLLVADRGTEKGELRHRLRHFQSAAIRDLLDAMRAAGLSSRRS